MLHYRKKCNKPPCFSWGIKTTVIIKSQQIDGGVYPMTYPLIITHDFRNLLRVPGPTGEHRVPEALFFYSKKYRRIGNMSPV